jgi:hypothetical protein
LRPQRSLIYAGLLLAPSRPESLDDRGTMGDRADAGHGVSRRDPGLGRDDGAGRRQKLA